MTGGDIGRASLAALKLVLTVSLHLPCLLGLHHGHVGHQEAQDVPQRARQQVPSQPQDPHPAYLVEPRVSAVHASRRKRHGCLLNLNLDRA